MGLQGFATRIAKSKVIPVLRNIGYLLGFSILINRAYNGVLAIQQGVVVLPGWGAIFLSLSISILALTCQIVSWRFVMKVFQANGMPIKEIFWGYTLSFLPRYIPGTIWGYMGRGNWLKTDYNITYKTSTYGSITELILMVVVNFILASQIFLQSLKTEIAVIIVLFIILGAILLLSLHRVRTLIKPIINRSNFINIFAAVGLQFCTWFFYGFSLFIVAEPLKAFHIIAYNQLFQYVSIYSAAWLVGFLIFFVPAGMGIRELALGQLLTSFNLFEAQTSNGLAIFFRLVVTVSELCMLILGWIVKKLFSSRILIPNTTKQ